ncbi:hypothetical protein BCR44DRAFT_1449525 [Catenaria anguillulae PL171]|uniref:tRNA N(3)-methylcytidine methyltransferase n=1 Tax=Catenaria anguillulae PL171 TaxID=765915 RepID=A0A1Y2H4P3_9FUNG|nr:hypothetical protein BCR44DRAFT_1449525 [Catenaria anguillulae PL171]
MDSPSSTSTDQTTPARDHGEAVETLDESYVKPFWAEKYRREACKNWDKFYKRNANHFYKPRHWTEREFPELQFDADEHKTLCEVGCGHGSFVAPLIAHNDTEQFDPARVTAFVADLTKDALTETVPRQSVDVASCIFVLSAIPPEDLATAVANVASVVKPGGTVVLRDYARYDQAELRFKASNNRLEDHLYCRQDGTLAHFFTREQLDELFIANGFHVKSSAYVLRTTVNRKTSDEFQRIFVQARYEKRLQ